MQKYLIVIGGATASGKTNLSIQLAQYFQAEIFSCDSRQFYREMNIGTAKPTKEELAAAPHHFINSLGIHENYSVGDYEKDVIQALAHYFEEKNIAILVGGSGLYIQAVCEGLDEYPDVPIQIREELETLFQQKGIIALQKELEQIDPIYYAKVDRQNPHRLMRAIAVYRASGQAFSSFQNQKKGNRDFQVIRILLDWEREELYDRINRRVDIMLEEGLEKEAIYLYKHKHLTALQTVGYQEFFDFFDEKIDREEAIRLIKRNSRRYAKRQMTWFRRKETWKAFHPNQVKAIIEFIEQSIEEKI